MFWTPCLLQNQPDTTIEITGVGKALRCRFLHVLHCEWILIVFYSRGSCPSVHYVFLPSDYVRVHFMPFNWSRADHAAHHYYYFSNEANFREMLFIFFSVAFGSFFAASITATIALHSTCACASASRSICIGLNVVNCICALCTS